ncbi:unnamed protein product [Merluccius merluccius]
MCGRRTLWKCQGQSRARAGPEQGQSRARAGPEPGQSRARAGPEQGQSRARAGLASATGLSASCVEVRPTHTRQDRGPSPRRDRGPPGGTGVHPPGGTGVHLPGGTGSWGPARTSRRKTLLSATYAPLLRRGPFLSHEARRQLLVASRAVK